MKVSAVFVVNEIAIKIIQEKVEQERLNYVLGFGSDESFENHIIEMDDFTETSSTFYSIMKKEWPFINENNMHCLCKQKNYSLFIIPSEELHKVDTAFNVDIKEGMENTLENVNLNLFKCDEKNTPIHKTIEKAVQFRNVIANGIQKKHNILFVLAQ